MEEATMDLRTRPRPLKEGYRQDSSSARITLRAEGGQTDTPLSCSVDLGRAIYQPEAHRGIGGGGVSGMHKLSEVEDNVGATGWQLASAELVEIDRIFADAAGNTGPCWNDGPPRAARR